MHKRSLAIIAAVAALAAVAVSLRPAAATETIAREAILVDPLTGTVLFEKDADRLTIPSSMTKLMTAYLLFEQIKNGGVSLDDQFPVSEKAWRLGGSKMFVEVGKRVRVEDLIRGIVIQSGNDACVVVAEALAGDEDAFAEQMTRKARQLGMNDTTFKNASGWPADGHLTTMRDLATLSQRIIEDFPEFFRYYAETEFTYAGIRQENRNPLLYKNIGADGLKTGHTNDAGYGLAATAVREGRRLILVVNGLPSMAARASESERLLMWGFREFENYPLFKAGETVFDAKVWLGEASTVPVMIDRDVLLTMKRSARAGMKVKVRYDEPVPVPIKKGQPLADLVIEAPGEETLTYRLNAAADVPQLGLTRRLGAALGYIIWGAS